MRKVDTLLQANQWLSQKVGTTFSVELLGSGAGGDDRQLVFGDAHALGQDDAEAVEECGLGLVRLGDASQAVLAWVAVGNTTSCDWMRASSSRMVRGEFPRPARCCHISRLFHSTKARKHTRIWA